MHSQYSRLLIEFGFLGFFVLMVLFLIIHTPKGIFSCLSSCFLIFSIYIPFFVFYATYDVFVISQSLVWLPLAIGLASPLFDRSLRPYS